uniref:Uncharacterized protein n=1 Tax=Arundo donax TaxID=35708 RepID=A0A0A9CRZ3_ARUDO
MILKVQFQVQVRHPTVM